MRTPDSSSSEYQSSIESTSSKRPSLLSRLFRRSRQQKAPRQIESYSAQFPPTEWFNSRAVHLHNVGTQTNDQVTDQLLRRYLIERVPNQFSFSSMLLFCLSSYRTCLYRAAFCPAAVPATTTAPKSVNSRPRYPAVTVAICPASRPRS